MLKQKAAKRRRCIGAPAAFRRLCVETTLTASAFLSAPPAAFRRLCVETPIRNPTLKQKTQPPSGGCVLKHACKYAQDKYACPAAFRRLCVETLALKPAFGAINLPAAFRRLCVETAYSKTGYLTCGPAAFRRLCVETPDTSALSSR